jgi:hypothetical protein
VSEWITKETGKVDLLWPNWVGYLRQEGRSEFIAQGTLINKHSIGQTIGHARLHGPVVASGVRRIFNFALEDQNYVEHGGRYTRSVEPERRATLNILETANDDDRVNGILFSTDAEDIDALAEREYGYDLLPVQYEMSGAKSIAYMFVARTESQTIGHRVLSDILPNESSLSICLTGAATYGAAFLETWIESCLLADKSPLIQDPYYAALIDKTLRTFDLQE